MRSPSRVIGAAALLLASFTSLNAQNFMQRFTPSAGTNNVNKGDFNGDGITDVIITTGTGVAVFLGQANGTLGARKDSAGTPSSTSGEFGLTVAQFTHSGHLDAATGNNAGGIDILLGRGDGTFRLAGTLPSAVLLTSGDFDGDGNADVVATTQNGISIFPGNGDGTFRPPVAVSNNPGSALVGDFDGNGKSDLAVVHFDRVTVLFNNGNFSFTPVDVVKFDTTVEFGVSVVPVDINQDGFGDLLVGTGGTCDPKRCSGGFRVYRSRGKARAFTLAFKTAFGVSGLKLAATDIDRDGITDILATDCGSECFLTLFKGLPNGSFQPTITYRVNGADVMADLNRDGRPDLLLGNDHNGSLGVSLNALLQAACSKSTLSPAVTICGAVDQTYVKSPLHLTVKTNDTAHPVTKIQVLVDNQLRTQTTASSFSPTLTLTSGNHSILVKATDSAGTTFIAKRRVTAFAGNPGQVCSTPLDTVHICAPAQGASVTSPVRVFAAGYNDFIVTSFQVFIDGKQVSIDRSRTNYIDRSFTVAPGSHTLVVKFFESTGSRFSQTRTFTVH